MLFIPSVFAQYTIGGNAQALANDCFRLTSAVNTQSGYVYQTAAINLNEPFDKRFRVYLGTKDGNGADGIMFVMKGGLNTPLIGTGGGGIGFPGLNPVLGVEVDTYQNSTFGDPTFDHIGIFKTGNPYHTSPNSLAGPIQADPTTINVEDGAYHWLNLSWDPATTVFEVYFDCEPRLTYTGNLVDSVFGGDSLVHWGFIGTTGGLNNDQRFCITEPLDSLVLSLSDVSTCSGDSISLNAGSTKASYLWTPSTGLSSNTSNSPLASPTDTTTYVVRATYGCDTLYDTVTVNIIPADFTTSSIVENAQCKGTCDGEINLSVSGGNTYDYLWSNNETTEDIDDLCQGTYYVTVTNTNSSSTTFGCYVLDTILVTEPPLLITNISNATKTSCPGVTACDASASITVTGGTPAYSYLWSNGENTSTPSQLCPDTNWVTVTDANGCDTVDYVEIDVPTPILAQAFGDTLICISNVASLAATGTGGTPPYNYVWRRGSLNGAVVSTTAFVNVFPSVTTQYFVSVSDANNCPGDSAVSTVLVRPPLDVDILEPDTICPYDTIDIEANGLGGDSIYTYSWSTGVFDSIITVSPDEPSWYYLTVSDACGTPSHRDSVFVQVGGYSRIKATIKLDDDSLCVGESTYFIGSASGGYNGPDEFTFKWSHTNSRQRTQFVSPAVTTDYILNVVDQCLSPVGRDTVTVHVGSPEKPKLFVDPPLACGGTDVTFAITNSKRSTRYDWNFGDGISINNYLLDTISHRYENEGCYDLMIQATTAFGCYSDRVYPCYVQINPVSLAQFEAVPSGSSSLDPFVELENKSKNTKQWMWVIGSDTLFEPWSPRYEFPEDSATLVKLFTESDAGCIDSVQTWIGKEMVPTLYIPTSFSPNGDDVNDEFRVFGEAVDLRGYELKIYDRWGEVLFNTTDPDATWDGSVNGKGKVPNGVYLCEVYYIDDTKQGRVIRQNLIVANSGKKIPLK